MTNNIATKPITAQRVWFDTQRVYVELNDGRVVGSPLAWFPRLKNATDEQRNRYELLHDGYAIHWPGLDEDLLAEGFLTFSR